MSAAPEALVIITQAEDAPLVELRVYQGSAASPAARLTPEDACNLAEQLLRHARQARRLRD